MVSIFSRKKIPSASFAQEKESTSLFLLEMRDSIWLSSSAKMPMGVTALSGYNDLEMSRSRPFYQAINHPAAAACPSARLWGAQKGCEEPRESGKPASPGVWPLPWGSHCQALPAAGAGATQSADPLPGWVSVPKVTAMVVCIKVVI